MSIARRSLFLSAPALLLGRHQARAAGALRLERVDDTTMALTADGVARPLLLSGTKIRLLAPLPLGDSSLAAAMFTLAGGNAWLDIAAIARHDGLRIYLLALEPIAWRGRDGARLATRLSATGDRLGLRLRREAALPRSPTLWQREAWTDYLRWEKPLDGTPGRLVDAPVRPPLPETRQHAIALLRRQAATLVASSPAALNPALLAEVGLQAATFSLSVSVPPSMPAAPAGSRIPANEALPTDRIAT